MLTATERELVIQAVSLLLARGDARDQISAALLSPDEMEHIEYWKRPYSYARNAVLYCEGVQDDGGQRLLYRLLRGLYPLGGSESLEKIIQRLDAPLPKWRGAPTLDPEKTHWLGHIGKPFVGRFNLRQALAALGRADGPSVVLINGSRRSGKSYSVEMVLQTTRFLVNQIIEAADPPKPNPPLVDLAAVFIDQGMGASATPYYLVNRFCDCMLSDKAVTARVHANTTEFRAGSYLCAELLTRARESKQRWWLIVDGLNSSSDVLPETRDFINQLVKELEDAAYREWLRLILIGYPRENLEAFSPKWIEEEQINDSSIGETHLRDFIQALFLSQGVDSKEVVDLALYAVLKRMSADQNERLQALNQALSTLSEQEQ